jgi:hypothetical protein
MGVCLYNGSCPNELHYVMPVLGHLMFVFHTLYTGFLASYSRALVRRFPFSTLAVRWSRGTQRDLLQLRGFQPAVLLVPTDRVADNRLDMCEMMGMRNVISVSRTH